MPDITVMPIPQAGALVLIATDGALIASDCV
jgi:hypothetical protein